MCSLFHNPVWNGCCRICWVMLECMSSLGLHFMEFSMMRLVSRWSELVVPPWFAWFAPDDAWLVVLMYHVNVHWSRTEKHVVNFFGTWFIRAVVSTVSTGGSSAIWDGGMGKTKVHLGQTDVFQAAGQSDFHLNRAGSGWMVCHSG